MEKIIVYKKEFEIQIIELIDILIARKYFTFEEYAVEYTIKIYEFIENNISFPISKNCPKKYHRFGKKFLKYKANNRTTWYIFFDQKGNQFLVNHILNNHSQDFPELL
ncbi:hypothetical protein [Kaistella antarctica]|uniref:Type II toxin-antitoxin system RelE/ParE family toxin n=1 Tax=Kaistella antarctica TaxID=266748 RepID=A0A448NNR7_9FLAO|nr:hypothetical protein [Kaistella antarctica]KEY19667.1 hypothetical protein HY04_00055 [Kaistella antarctica]SEV99202.1 hypothetical protein SAMN05421765_1762 [Kaistella antarctica]VEH96809.1 Uncharacterised protein [Kaistella antarctica]